MKITIEAGTQYDEMTDEQKELHEEIKSLIYHLETLSGMWSEVTEYNNPKFGNYKRERPAGFQLGGVRAALVWLVSDAIRLRRARHPLGLIFVKIAVVIRRVDKPRANGCPPPERG